MQRWIVLVVAAAVLVSCTNETAEHQRTRITFWHFWSEPTQEQALQRLVAAYEADHSDLEIELVPLAWSDGKSKLQLAFNAGTQPDIVHLGLDWFGEFDASGVFQPFSHDHMIGDRAALWVTNARALVHWTGPVPKYRWGFARSDVHNILKRSLPVIWQAGAPSFYTRTPIYQDINDELVTALWALRDTIRQGALLEPSRSLDERFLRGEIEFLYTGSWIMEMARDRGITSFEVLPGRSLLNADVLCISKGSAVPDSAAAVISWLTAYPQASAFCHAIPDAGFPATQKVFGDSTFRSDPIQEGFLSTALWSFPVPASPVILSIEPIVEDLIERCYTASSRDEVAELVETARAQVEELERSSP